jgi:hypothetical protein
VAGPMEVGEGEARVRAAVLMEEVEAAVRAQAAGVQAEARVEAAATASALSPTWTTPTLSGCSTFAPAYVG